MYCCQNIGTAGKGPIRWIGNSENLGPLRLQFYRNMSSATIGPTCRLRIHQDASNSLLPVKNFSMVHIVLCQRDNVSNLSPFLKPDIRHPLRDIEAEIVAIRNDSVRVLLGDVSMDLFTTCQGSDTVFSDFKLKRSLRR